RLGDDRGLVVLPERAEGFRIGPPVRAHIVAATLDPLDDVGKILADQAVEQDRRGQPQLVEQAEDPPNPDAETVIAPGEVALRLRAAALRGIGAAAGYERELLDVERH